MTSDNEIIDYSSPEEVAGRILRWAKQVPQGFAMVVTNNAALREEAVQMLARQASEQEVSFRRVILPFASDGASVAQSLEGTLKSQPFELVSVEGFSIAFGNKATVLDGLRVLNTFRERLSEIPGCQVWWVSPMMLQSMRLVAPDLVRYFLITERLPDRDETVPGSVWSKLQLIESGIRPLNEESLWRECIDLFVAHAPYLSAEDFFEFDDRLATLVRRESGMAYNGLVGELLASSNTVSRSRRVVEIAWTLDSIGKSEEALEVIQHLMPDRESALTSVATATRAKIFLSLGAADLGLEEAQISLTKANELAAVFGETREPLRSKIEALERIADAYQQLGHFEDSLSASEQMVAACERSIAKYGESRESLSFLCGALERLADTRMILGMGEQSLAVAEQGLWVCERINGEFGEEHHSLRGLCVCLMRVADAHLRLRNGPIALSIAEQSEKVCKRIIAVYGETRESLRDLSISLCYVSDAHRLLGNGEQALLSAERTRAGFDQILRQYGESYASINDIIESELNLVSLRLQSGEIASFDDLTRRSSQFLLPDNGLAPLPLQRLLLKVWLVALTSWHQALTGDQMRAKANLAEAEKLIQERFDRFGPHFYLDKRVAADLETAKRMYFEEFGKAFDESGSTEPPVAQDPQADPKK